MIRRIARSRVTGLIAFLIILTLPGEPLLAALQQGGDEYAKKVKEAENKYLLGDFDSSIKILEESLRSLNFPQTLKKSAYELLAQNYLAKSYLEQAKAAIKKLLTLVPTYVPPADNPPFVAEVERVRQEMGTKTAEEPVQKKEKEEEATPWYGSTLVLVGGGVLVAGGVALLLLGKKDEGGGTTTPTALPGPPALP
jgi:tetratricopeptide (TPR) repeat protein